MIPIEHRLMLRVRYNGYLHSCEAIRNAGPDGVTIHVFSDQFPKGYRAENDDHELVFEGLEAALSPDPSGEHGWICSSEVDIDSFAERLPQ